MQPIPPFWFKQRQCKAEPAGSDHELKLTGPNLGEAFIRIVPEGSQWKAALRLAPTSGDVQATAAEFPNAGSAWGAAFELYRTHVII